LEPQLKPEQGSLLSLKELNELKEPPEKSPVPPTTVCLLPDEKVLNGLWLLLLPNEDDDPDKIR
jgi:hypothetical protein